MPTVTALMISQDDCFIRSVKGVARSIKDLQLEVCDSIAAAHSFLGQDDLVLVLLHLTRNADETEVARFLEATSKANPVCATLAFSDVYRNHQAVAILRAGATDYFGLPQDLAKLAYLFDVLTLRARNGGTQVSTLPKTPAQTRADPGVFVLAPELVAIMDQVLRVVSRDTTLLLTGETGTGKTRLARLIHELSPRREEPFLVVDCGALSANLIESEMFGHARGAFTGADRDREGKFAAVGGGTLLLDEINALPLHLQSKLLRAVEERVFEPVGLNKLAPLQARIIAVSNAPLEEEVRAGRFRADLYYRLNVVGFYLPPLRDRVTTIPPLANKFVAEFSLRSGHEMKGISPDAIQFLTKYNWPGNIRELRNVIERAVTLAAGPVIDVDDLPEAIRRSEAVPPPVTQAPWQIIAPNGQASPAPMPLSHVKENAEVARIAEALLKHGNNRLRAAAELGISRMALYKKLHKYGMINTA